MTAAMLYVHVPFCVSKCAYCDFASVAGASRDERAAYLSTVRRHIDHHIAAGAFEGGAPSVYVGGGTPTLLGADLVELVRWIAEHVPLAQEAEVTVETNPETTSAALVAGLVAAGVNRFSLGVQSFDDVTLKALGRCHDAASGTRAAEVLRRSGARLSVDLICGVPGLTAVAWAESLARAVSTGAGHVSVYPLTVEDGTPLARRIDDGETPEPDADRAAADMLVAAEVLAGAGYARYEVANYALPGEQSRHNTGYWLGVPYVGVGPGAAGMRPTANGRCRYAYERSLQEWLDSDPSDPPTECLTTEETAREDVMLGLRLTAGVSAASVEAAGLSAVLADLAARGLVERAGGRWRTTERGWLLGNEVFERVLFG